MGNRLLSSCAPRLGSVDERELNSGQIPSTGSCVAVSPFMIQKAMMRANTGHKNLCFKPVFPVSVTVLQKIFEEWILFLSGCATSPVTSNRDWSGFLGRSLSVDCQYNKGYVGYIKYWCRGAEWDSCETVVKTTGSEAEVKDGRTSIKDNQTLLEFTVRLDNLTLQDAGIYWCAIEKIGSDLKSLVMITVLPEPSTTAAITTGYVSTAPSVSPRTTDNPSSSLPTTILLPIVFLLLLVLLAGALLVMCRLKKQKAGKASRAIPLSTTPSSTAGNVSRAAKKKKVKSSSQTVPHYSDQATDSTEVEYSSVITAPAPNSQPQVPTEGVSYASLSFSARHEQAIYANV
ncbi:hypothetical protein lerEdw1_017796 [Lerista edwardsae]|nr:hypothetical protein lerEdw1_017796 [Lerista edwardsae]